MCFQRARALLRRRPCSCCACYLHDPNPKAPAMAVAAVMITLRMIPQMVLDFSDLLMGY